MSKIVRTGILLLIFVALCSTSWASPDEVADLLARAQVLYYEADFNKSIELLLRADELVRDQSGHVKEKSDVKLQLALGFIGLNDRVQAKRYFTELYAIDSD